MKKFSHIALALAALLGAAHASAATATANVTTSVTVGGTCSIIGSAHTFSVPSGTLRQIADRLGRYDHTTSEMTWGTAVPKTTSLFTVNCPSGMAYTLQRTDTVDTQINVGGVPKWVGGWMILDKVDGVKIDATGTDKAGRLKINRETSYTGTGTGSNQVFTGAPVAFPSDDALYEAGSTADAGTYSWSMPVEVAF